MMGDVSTCITAVENPQSSVVLWVLNNTVYNDMTPILFRVALWRYLQKQGRLVGTCASCDTLDDLKAHLSVSFLGEQYWYWLGSCNKLHEKLLAEYTGPHRLLGTITRAERDVYAQSSSAPIIIDIPSRVKLIDAYQLCVRIGAAPQVPDTVLLELSQKISPTITFDQALILGHYLTVCGVAGVAHYIPLLRTIMGPEESLFDFSSAFFSKNISSCMELWAKIGHQYPGQYWVSFFAEQLWQAILFLEERSSGSASAGHTQKYRLPFSFTTKDYKKHTIKDLTQAYQDLFYIDNSAKQGADIDAQLDLFIARFNKNYQNRVL